MAEKVKIKEFKREVDALRNVIRKTVDEVVGEKLGDIVVTGEAETEGGGSLEKRIASLEIAVENIDESVKEAVDEEFRNLSEGEGMEIVKGEVESGDLDKVNNKILMLKREIEMLRSELESSSVKRLEEELQKVVGSLKSQVNKVIVDSRDLEERIASELEDVKKEMINLKSKGEHAGGLNMKEFIRDLEIIKTKQEWIENNIERIDIKPILRKMEELEHRIRMIGGSAAVIVE